MRKTLIATLIMVCVYTIGLSQDTIPNYSFENWITNYTPKNWETTNIFLPLGFNTCSQSTNSHTGMYALFMETINMDGLKVPGVATLGTLDINSSSGGTPYNSKPVALKGFYQHPSNGDEVLIGVEFFKDGAEIGDASLLITDSVPDYTEFVIPITYYSNEIPDTLNITIVTDQFVVGSSLLIDDLEMEFQTNGEITYLDDPKFICIPNPSDGFVTVKLKDKGAAEIEIYSLEGKLIKEINAETSEIQVDLNSYKPGIYSVRIKQGDEISIDKIILR